MTLKMNVDKPQIKDGMHSNADEKTYKRFLPDLNSQKYKELTPRTAIEHTEKTFAKVPAVAVSFDDWKALYDVPFKGVTCDGKI